MEVQDLEIMWLDPLQSRDLNLPTYSTEGSSGMDVEAAVTAGLIIEPGGIALIPTGLTLAVAPGYEVQVRPRSGLAVQHGITLINSPGTIDADYRGEIFVPLINHGTEIFRVSRGDRIAQLVLAPVTRARLKLVSQLSQTARGSGGFGHSGV